MPTASVLSAFSLTALLCASLVGAPCAYGQVEHPITGRKIAPVMGFGGADWLERGEREMEELPEKALEEIGIKPGMVAADVGAGSGYFTSRLAKRVGPQGKVYAVDVQPEMLSLLRERMARQKISNVVTVLGSEANPRLLDASCDLILMVDVYHEFSQPQRMLQKLRAALKPEGKLVLLEYRKEDPRVPIRFEHKMSVAEAKAEVEAEAFKLDKVSDVLPRQHILIFSKKPN